MSDIWQVLLVLAVFIIMITVITLPSVKQIERQIEEPERWVVKTSALSLIKAIWRMWYRCAGKMDFLIVHPSIR